MQERTMLNCFACVSQEDSNEALGQLSALKLQLVELETDADANRRRINMVRIVLLPQSP